MVISGGTSSGRGLGVDRFYNPPAVRRQLEQQRQQQQQQEAALQRPGKAKPKPATPPFMEVPAIDRPVENRAQSDDSSKPSLSSSSSSSSASHSPSPSPPPRSMSPVANLDRFLESTTPMVTPQYFHMTNSKGWRKHDGVELRPYFTLGDLWESFEEWSAYGAGVPLVLNGGDCVVQYYVPYLSAIQLYTNASRTTFRARRLGEESNAGIYQDTSSDVSSESETERTFRKRRDSSTTHKDQHGLVGEENGVCKQTMLPVFEYLEHNPPYGREPLAEKISLLANKFPQLMTYRSCDLLPKSWISVAWYPIYRIPTGPTLRDLDACFLTFHTLSTPLKNSCNGHSELNDSCRVREANDFTQMPAKLSLPVFGLASYKLKGSIWTNKNLYEQQFASSLLQAAEEWLQFQKVDHPDFRFFLSHYNTS
ncbi:uncharacterized protein LOC110020928 [Phalaenopsis equestris]|uniref:uncharacterized protein LOC110020928 n=1 Tax=Phalaenopsis equestris TaxID=78828 RepID=UPI0009E401D1|nr:uncharacterized protein LOC110020928 [Phalaenopsis equestris]